MTVASTDPAVITRAHWSEQRKCLHNHRGHIRLLVANGAVQVRAGCLDCGFTAERNLPFREHPDRDTYPLVVPHPSPCDCHDDKTIEKHRRYQAGEYERYLASDQWAERRAYFIARAMNRCQLCNAPGGPGGGSLHLHHRTYARLGAELDVDVIVLCQRCHNTHHRFIEIQRGLTA